jgi:3-keto-disaccharide hydrolase
MRSHRVSLRSVAIAAVAVVATAFVLHGADPANFKPDATFKGSTLAGWRIVGNADWKAQNGELIGTAKSGGGGWLMTDKSFQDIDFSTNYRCAGTCAAGVLLRAQKTQDGGMKGVYLSLGDGDLAPYAVTVDAQGKESSRERIAAARAGGAGGGGGGGAGNAGRAAGAAGAAAAPAARGGRAAAPEAGGAGQAAPAAAPPAGVAARAGGGGGGGRGAPPSLKAGTLRAIPGGGGPVDAAGFGAVALFVGGTGEVHFKDVAWKDLNTIAETREQTSPRYNALHISSFYYGWSAAASDINHDGVLDIVSGPFYFPGPNFTERHIYREGRIYNAATEYAPRPISRAMDGRTFSLRR